MLKVSAARELLDLLHCKTKLGQKELCVALIRHSCHFTEMFTGRLLSPCLINKLKPEKAIIVSSCYHSSCSLWGQEGREERRGGGRRRGRGEGRGGEEEKAGRRGRGEGRGGKEEEKAGEERRRRRQGRKGGGEGRGGEAEEERRRRQGRRGGGGGEGRGGEEEEDEQHSSECIRMQDPSNTI